MCERDVRVLQNKEEAAAEEAGGGGSRAGYLFLMEKSEYTPHTAHTPLLKHSALL